MNALSDPLATTAQCPSCRVVAGICRDTLDARCTEDLMCSICHDDAPSEPDTVAINVLCRGTRCKKFFHGECMMKYYNSKRPPVIVAPQVGRGVLGVQHLPLDVQDDRGSWWFGDVLPSRWNDRYEWDEQSAQWYMWNEQSSQWYVWDVQHYHWRVWEDRSTFSTLLAWGCFFLLFRIMR